MKHIDKVRRDFAALSSGGMVAEDTQAWAKLGKQMGGVLSYVAELEKKLAAQAEKDR